ncbi:GTP 3',8-cyclase MoaA [Sutterella sp.]|uniref:GTP 3',8-cyclase MoaA n=1 Tax=Sutterella sp. TaxID=1981025 RepID=UPI0026DF88F6|nr:GTP 3',8-cyclase MoaA [Sutterella sp.]MDO5531579.1 GTP 3',8-cyclase MoaA [Sutterella sp.]
MNEGRVVPVRPVRVITRPALPIPQAGEIRREGGAWRDRLGRPLTDLRISVTDHCNFRCRYCMPKEKFAKNHQFLAMTELLTFEEILRVSRIAVRNGIEKIRLTGGEPLLRKGIEGLVADLAQLKTPAGKPIDLAMTTNGSLLVRKAEALKAAGLKRVTVSLDAIDEEIFQGFNDVGYPAAKVLEAIDFAQKTGLKVKVNTVVKKGVNEGEIVRIAERFRGTGVIPRFIEYMDVGNANGWRMDEVVPSREVVSRIAERWPVEPMAHTTPGETASRWRYTDGSGEFGVISSVTQNFCRTCSRVRLSMEGRLYLCLFASIGYDIRTMLRGGCTEKELEDAFGRIWTNREDRYSELRALGAAPERDKVEMNYIGG